MATSIRRSIHATLDEALQGARDALERLRATLATHPLADADPSRTPTEPGAGPEPRLRVRR